MEWILSAVILLVVWAIWFVLGASAWIPLVVTALVVATGVTRLISSRFRASRAVRAFRAAIAAEGSQRALDVRPDRRASLQELQTQMAKGISALRSSKLGREKGDTEALYALPWYVIIGPPGAGKTTALKQSRLVLPSADPVRGVGGTRNCDWWFADGAILLDTAGRYAAEQDDRDEWLTFLRMLRKHRPKRPVDGILAAVGISDLIECDDPKIEATGKKLRARIDEVMTELQMIVPVYVLFTKVDLVAGFGEFFGDLPRSERDRVWGATLGLDRDKADPGGIFEAEFDLLVKQLHCRSLKLVAKTRGVEARGRIYRFPLEFAGMKRNLAQLLTQIFAENTYQGTPLFRGVYFTSGTQEGKPLELLLARMMSICGLSASVPDRAPSVVPKSYFLHDVFANVVFPDKGLAVRSEGELDRQRWMRLAIGAAAVSFAAILLVPSISSFVANRAFLLDTKQRAQTALQVVGPASPVTRLLDRLDPVLDRLVELDSHRTQGIPAKLAGIMYRGSSVRPSLVAVYASRMEEGFILLCQRALEERLGRAKGDEYWKERADLRTYLMLSDVEHLDVAWATGRVTEVLSKLLASKEGLDEREIRKRLSPHVRYYLDLVKGRETAPGAADASLVADVRKALMKIRASRRYDDLFVRSIGEERRDPSGGDSRDNRRYPPLTLADVFAHDPEALKVMTSRCFTQEKVWQKVDGPFTVEGRRAVAMNIEKAAELLQNEQWVVPLAEDEKGSLRLRELADLTKRYDQRFIEQWVDWLSDITVKAPSTADEAIVLYEALTPPVSPHRVVLRTIEDHTKPLVGSRQPIFGMLLEWGTASLAGYLEILSELDWELIRGRNAGVGLWTDAVLRARQKSEALLMRIDGQTKGLLVPLLLGPLDVPRASQSSSWAAGSPASQAREPRKAPGTLPPCSPRSPR